MTHLLPTIQQTFHVRFSYPVCFTFGLFRPNNSTLRDSIAAAKGELPKLLCVIDSGVAAHHPRLAADVEAYFTQHSRIAQLVAPPLVVQGGEAAKNSAAHVDAVLHAIDRYGIDRHAYVMAIGGGALIDMVGYAAATAHRGVRLIRVPTTVLAQNDAAVGVKNSINAFGKKNFLGTFAPPYAVLNDFDFLTTLSERDWRSGISEAIKVALLKDAPFFAAIERDAGRLASRDMPAMQQLIHRCAELHLQHIAGGDPFESGSARPLDFGHWAAHKLEHLSGYSLRHGEAVAIGIALDSTYAMLAGMLPEGDWHRILRLTGRLGFSLYAGELGQHLYQRDHPRCLLRGLTEFREHLGGRLTITLLDGIGRGVEVHEIDEPTMTRSVEILKTYNHSL